MQEWAGEIQKSEGKDFFRSHERRCESEERRKKQITVVYPLQVFVNF